MECLLPSPNFHRPSYKRIIALSTQQRLKPFNTNHTKDLIPTISTKSYSICAKKYIHVYCAPSEKDSSYPNNTLDQCSPKKHMPVVFLMGTGLYYLILIKYVLL